MLLKSLSVIEIYMLKINSIIQLIDIKCNYINILMKTVDTICDKYIYFYKNRCIDSHCIHDEKSKIHKHDCQNKPRAL